MPDSATDLLERSAEAAADTAAAAPAPAGAAAEDVIAADLLVEEISIDGMCGVY
ncbi:MAG TPA: mycofactocin precursor MftA [Streptosporangiaceae bacterium]|nr:mycofactocin precursor MftA [Streptosporangiaceae bacterium]